MHEEEFVCELFVYVPFGQAEHPDETVPKKPGAQAEQKLTDEGDDTPEGTIVPEGHCAQIPV